ncbi:probable cytochrome P450 6a13 [Bradysia coprophila]|uniref:probable cytochrome P450 6a13 n=1 Tax=Bradysia coprophila TaxID=38358 RepID=UPI00187D896C|nr:probable cytochrome P450 6a13 [Bradysia coprophila]
MFLVFVLALLSLSYVWLRNRYSYWDRRKVRGPKPVFLFGNLLKQLTFREHIGLAYQRWYNTYNNASYVGFYKLLQPAVMIRDPELQREMLVKAFTNFQTNDVTVSDGDELLKSNPFFVTGEEWRHGRALFSTFLSANKTKAVFPAMLTVGNEWEQYVRTLGENAEVDAKDICSRFTTETMLRCTFSIDGKSFESHRTEFLDMGKSVFNPDMITAMKSMFVFLVPSLQKFIKVSTVPKLLAKRFTDIVREQMKIRDSGAVYCEDVLQFVLNSRKKFEMTETQIIGTCTVFFIEAYETSANTLSLALYNLAKHHHIQEELARRIQESFVANDNEITYDLIHKHEYLEKVAFECMRIQTTFFGVQKLCTKPFRMPLLPGQTEPVTIPVGTPVVIPFNAVQQDPVHYPDPDLFDPERFSAEQRAQRLKSAYMPFSDGPRMCIGMHLAMFNFKMGLFQIIRRFDVKLHPNNEPFEMHPMSFFNIPMNGIKLTLTPRKTV